MPHTRNGGLKKRASESARQAAAMMDSAYEGSRDRLREYADRAIAGAEEQFEAAQEITGKYLEEGREAVESAGSALKTYVRSHPGKALVVAAGVGLLFSFFLRRR